MDMQGYTIQELSELLGISERAVYLRILKRGIEPLTRQAVYSKDTLKLIKETSKGGRGKKLKP